MVEDLPLTKSYNTNSFETEGNPSRKGRAEFNPVSAGYFQTMRIPLYRGRLYDDSDTESSPSVGIVSRALAQRYWPDEDPIGRAVLTMRSVSEQTAGGPRTRIVKQRIEIVGVVGDVREHGPDSDAHFALYLPYRQSPPREMSLVLRTAADPAPLIPLVRQEIRRIDPDLPVTGIQTMDDWLSADTAPRRFILLSIGVFALLAVSLAAVGIYGVVSYSVTQCTREIGIRMALGAGWEAVIWWVVRQTAGWLAAGIALGGGGAAAVTHLLQTYLFAVAPGDPSVFGLVALVLAAIALGAHALPARRAIGIDPLEALRFE
jgi:putative ABC transport system permease protein